MLERVLGEEINQRLPQRVIGGGKGSVEGNSNTCTTGRRRE